MATVKFTSDGQVVADKGFGADTSITIKPHASNEVNFGGTNDSTAIYFGYRATDSRAIPTSFIFGYTGTASIQAGAVYNAVWNDLADCIPIPDDFQPEAGYCYCFDGLNYYKSTKYLDDGIIGISSDTYGFAMGKNDADITNRMPVAVAGFVLAYVDKEYPVGTPLTCTFDGYLTEISLEDKMRYPEKIVATYWKNEPAEIWGTENRVVQVLGRKWVKIK